jgi:hypothetical protein
MASLIQGFIREIETARRSLTATAKAGKQIQSQPKRDVLRGLAERYFSTVRPAILPKDFQDAGIATVDAKMQQLIQLCHRRGLARAYAGLLSDVRAALITVDMRSVSTRPGTEADPPLAEADQLIMSTLDSILPTAANSFRQALLDLQEPERLSWRGPATDLRECLRETLDHLAPDSEVIKEPGYKPEPNTSGPTMKQKTRYLLRLRGLSKSQTGATEQAVDSVDEALGMFVRSVYTRSNVSTHTATSRNEVTRIRDLVRVVLAELLEVRV